MVPDQQPDVSPGPLKDPSTESTFGDVVPTRSRASSKIEAQVKMFLADGGYQVAQGRAGVLCHHTDPKWPFLTLTPDVILAGLRLAIEVDPCGPTPSHRGSSHFGNEATDKLRNDLLAAVGWTVIRLRLGAEEGQHIGDRDVVVQSSGFTKAAQNALIEAIEDFKNDRPPTVRLVRKSKSPEPAQRRSHVVNIGLDQYSDDTYWFTWYPELDQPKSHSFRLAAAGRYLYAMTGRESRFVEEIGLHRVDRALWKARLTSHLDGRMVTDLVATTKWPWGDLLLVATDPDDVLAAEIVQSSDHEKQTIDRISFWFTVSGAHVASWSSEALCRADGVPVVTMHPDAVAAGYRFADVSQEHGYRGAYQRVVVSRAPLPEPA